MFSLVKNIVKNTNKLKIKSIISPFSDSILKSNLLLNTNKKFFFFKKSKNKNDSISSSENVKQEKENIAKVENKLKEENKSEELKGDENKTSSESEKVNLNTEEGSDKMDEKEKESTKENKNESNEIFTKPLLSQMEVMLNNLRTSIKTAYSTKPSTFTTQSYTEKLSQTAGTSKCNTKSQNKVSRMNTISSRNP